MGQSILPRCHDCEVEFVVDAGERLELFEEKGAELPDVRRAVILMSYKRGGQIAGSHWCGRLSHTKRFFAVEWIWGAACGPNSNELTPPRMPRPRCRKVFPENPTFPE